MLVLQHGALAVRAVSGLSLGSRLKAMRNGAAAASVGRRSGSHTMLCFILVRGRPYSYAARPGDLLRRCQTKTRWASKLRPRALGQPEPFFLLLGLVSN